MGAGWMGSAGGETAPEMDDRHSIADRRGVNQFILESGIPIDRLVDRTVKGDDVLDIAHIMPKPVHEGRIVVEEGAESLHVVSVPGGCERRRHKIGRAHV